MIVTEFKCLNKTCIKRFTTKAGLRYHQKTSTTEECRKTEETNYDDFLIEYTSEGDVIVETKGKDGSDIRLELVKDKNSLSKLEEMHRQLVFEEHRCMVKGCEKCYSTRGGLKYHLIHGHNTPAQIIPKLDTLCGRKKRHLRAKRSKSENGQNVKNEDHIEEEEEEEDDDEVIEEEEIQVMRVKHENDYKPKERRIEEDLSASNFSSSKKQKINSTTLSSSSASFNPPITHTPITSTMNTSNTTNTTTNTNTNINPNNSNTVFSSPLPGFNSISLPSPVATFQKPKLNSHMIVTLPFSIKKESNSTETKLPAPSIFHQLVDNPLLTIGFKPVQSNYQKELQSQQNQSQQFNRPLLDLPSINLPNLPNLSLPNPNLSIRSLPNLPEQNSIQKQNQEMQDNPKQISSDNFVTNQHKGNYSKNVLPTANYNYNYNSLPNQPTPTSSNFTNSSQQQQHQQPLNNTMFNTNVKNNNIFTGNIINSNISSNPNSNINQQQQQQQQQSLSTSSPIPWIPNSKNFQQSYK